MDTYFSKFPQIMYNNHECKDITRRVKISEQTKSMLSLYYMYVVKNGTRPDIIANAYYNDPYTDWLLFLTNNIVDPYSQWHLSDQDFEALLNVKYNGYENAFKKIAYYRNNWYDDETQLRPTFYENTLAQSLKKYYSPIWDEYNKTILAWKRKEEDWVVSTNKIIKLFCEDSDLVPGELVDIYDAFNVRVGGGEMVVNESTFIIIKNVDGAIEPTYMVKGETSRQITQIISKQILEENITEEEGVFWSPVSYYDLENEKNERNKSIMIIDNNYLFELTEQVRNKLKE